MAHDCDGRLDAVVDAPGDGLVAGPVEVLVAVCGEGGGAVEEDGVRELSDVAADPAVQGSPLAGVGVVVEEGVDGSVGEAGVLGDGGVFAKVGHEAGDVGGPDLLVHDGSEPGSCGGVGEVEDAGVEAGAAGDDRGGVGGGILDHVLAVRGFVVEVVLEPVGLGADVGEEGVDVRERADVVVVPQRLHELAPGRIQRLVVLPVPPQPRHVQRHVRDSLLVRAAPVC